MKKFIVCLFLVPYSLWGQEITKFDVEVAIGPNFGMKKMEGRSIRKLLDVIYRC